MAMEIEVADVSPSTEPADGAIAAGLSAADIVNGDGVTSTASSQGSVPVEPEPEEITSTLVDTDDDESTSTTLPEINLEEQRRLAESAFEIELAEAKESHSAAAILRSECESELKEAKADEKAALKKVQNLLNRGPSYPQQITKIEQAVANDKDSPSAIQVDDANADVTWKLIPTSSLIEGIKGMGDAKAEKIIDLAPTLGDLEELRAAAGKAHKPFASVLPKGIGRNMADELEERILTVVSKHCLALASASASEDDLVEADDDDDLEIEEVSGSQPEYMDVDDL